jgi:hypothetical protein
MDAEHSEEPEEHPREESFDFEASGVSGRRGGDSEGAEDEDSDEHELEGDDLDEDEHERSASGSSWICVWMSVNPTRP